MHSADYVANQITKLKNQGIPLTDVAWQTALNCVGWAYVFGSDGQYCTPANRTAYFKSKGADHPTIKTACQVIRDSNPKSSCEGCKWYPNGKKTRFFDCRGFTRWVLKQVYNWTLQGGGCTSQWNTADNWSAKGTIDTCPNDTLVCLFVYDKTKNNYSHTGFGYKGETIECSSGVQHFTTRNKKWTHWAVPKCVSGIEPVPVPTGYAEVTGKNVAIRQEPSTKANVLTRVPTGNVVKLETPPPSEWDYVTYGKTTGYMMKKYLKEGTGK